MPTAIETKSVIVWDSMQVAAFADGNADILVLERPPLDEIREAVLSGAVKECRFSFDRESAESAISTGLRKVQINSPALATDILALAWSFLEQFALKTANIRIELVKSQSCPKFHCDNVHIRLVTTYLGPTTEYQITGDRNIYATPLYGLTFLKGHQSATHRDTVHHRSPEVPEGEKRLCVVIDY